jgi:hypothetical protein
MASIVSPLVAHQWYVATYGTALPDTYGSHIWVVWVWSFWKVYWIRLNTILLYSTVNLHTTSWRKNIGSPDMIQKKGHHDQAHQTCPRALVVHAASNNAKIPFSAPRQTLHFPNQHPWLVTTDGTEPGDTTLSSCRRNCNFMWSLLQPLQQSLSLACSYLM